MGKSPYSQEEWREDGSAEPPADLLRRALSHVEDLLGRLEYPAVKQGELQPLAAEERVDLDTRPTSSSPANIAGMHAPLGLDVPVDEDPLVRQARETAQRIREEAHATADTIVFQARKDAQSIRERARAEADELTRAAAAEAEQTLAGAEAQAAARLAADRADADAAAADRARALELLEAARGVVLGLKVELRAAGEVISSSLGSLGSSVDALDALLAPAAEPAPTPNGSGR
jgi:F0F1-type ATP synthase membrane subunit b/b'